MKKLKFAILFSALTVPYVTFAQALLTSTGNFFAKVLGILTETIIPIVFALAMLFFFWGIANYIRKEGNEKDEARKAMVWGVIALFVLASVWGLVRLIQSEFGIRNTEIPVQIPKFAK
jgi:predicted PurR-regulated permease PerM